METFIYKFSEVMECDPSNITEDTAFRDHANWDSLVHLALIAMIDEDYEVVIPQKDFAEIKTVGEIISYIDQKNS